MTPQKKIFIARITTGNMLIPNAGATPPVALGMYLAEEDITVIGWVLKTEAAFANPLAGVGNVNIYAYLCSGYVQGTGYVNVLDSVQATMEQNAVNVVQEFKHSYVMFPDGQGISLKEGEHLELNCTGNNSTAAIVGASFWATMYYVKGAR